MKVVWILIFIWVLIVVSLLVGVSMATGIEVLDESPSGSGTTLSLVHAPITGSLKLFKNTVRLVPGYGNNYLLSGNTITLTTAKVSGDVFRADYKYL
jgi:hypothetical protein